MNKAPIDMTIGEILKTEFLEPLGLSQYRLAQATGIPESTLSKIINGHARITTEISIRLGRYFSSAPDYFARLQLACEIYNHRASVKAAEQEIVPLEIAS
ncbi:MAG: addiction module antidote protein, HigA family [Puniceicoccaceae bacterium]|nr:MAG: addiction module antidote protein, HigA family [Puniceicoccaceae bacterium]